MNNIVSILKHQRTPNGHIEDIAFSLEIHELHLRLAFDRFNQTGSGPARQDLVKAVAHYNSILEGYLPRLAGVTNNPVDKLKALKPTDELGLYFGALGSEFLRTVIRYQSFNREIWYMQGWQSYDWQPDGRQETPQIARARH